MNYESRIIGASNTAQAFFRAYEAHDIDAMLSLCTSTAQLRHIPMGHLETGNVHTVGRKAWSDMFTALPKLKVTPRLTVAGDFHVAAEVVISDSARGFELPQAYFFTVDDGYAITNVTVYWDNVTLGIEGTKAGGLRLIEAIASLGRH
jgi:ketosteroid isomerase-like protein